jgi:uncharacterized phage protein (TIGR01671 family)
MRDIKFKVYVRFLQEVHNVTELRSDGSVMTDGYQYAIEKSAVDLMQFTGLTDKNGVDIYEGYIFSGKSKVFGCITGEVQFCECDDAEGYQHEKHLGWNINGAPIVDLVGDGLEVIGNIHQHQELLEK